MSPVDTGKDAVQNMCGDLRSFGCLGDAAAALLLALAAERDTLREQLHAANNSLKEVETEMTQLEHGHRAQLAMARESALREAAEALRRKTIGTSWGHGSYYAATLEVLSLIQPKEPADAE